MTDKRISSMENWFTVNDLAAKFKVTPRRAQQLIAAAYAEGVLRKALLVRMLLNNQYIYRLQKEDEPII